MLSKKKCLSVLTIISFIITLPASQNFALAGSRSTCNANSLNGRLQTIRRDIRQKSSRSIELRNNIERLQNQIDDINAELDELNQTISTKTENIQNLQNKINELQDALSKRIKAIYVSDTTPDLELFALVTDMDDDFEDKFYLIQKISKDDFENIKNLSASLAEMENEKNSIKEAQERAAAVQEELTVKKNELESLLKNNNSLISILKRKEMEIENQKKKAAEDAGRSQLEHIRSSNSKPYSKGRYIWPMQGYRNVTSRWGGRRGHKGIDISGPGIYGAPIVAVADGVVIKANSSDKWGSGWGYHVMVDHGDKYATQYAHCSSVVVSPGQNVKAGQVIGYVGSTGHSTGPHLHFETWKNGTRYNPADEFNT